MSNVNLITETAKQYIKNQIVGDIEKYLVMPNHHEPGDKLCEWCFAINQAKIVVQGRYEQ